LLATTGLANAEGVLNIYNWGNYTSPELIKKFEEAHKVKVTITEYDSNDTALAKVRQGGHGFDMVVPSGTFIPIWIQEGLIMEARPDQMENFKNVDPLWVNAEFDPGRRYTVPWQIGVTGIEVNTKVFSGDAGTSAIFLDPPAELVGKINVVPEMIDVVNMTIMYFGGELCTNDKELLKKVRDKLVEAKPKWASIDYGTVDQYVKGDYAAGVNWNGAAMRGRLQNPDLKFAYPKEGFPLFSDNVAILKDAKNVDNAKLFMNFIMVPENAALISGFARYANGIKGSDAFLPADMKDAPELTIPADLLPKAKATKLCAPETMDLYTKIWTDVMK
jgi:spermidine/putrescine transport system substrate-binding protein